MDLDGDNRQQEQDERIRLDPSWADYWAKREQDRKAEKAFWDKFWEKK